MTKNKQISEENKAAIRAEVKQARKDGEPTLASIAAKYEIHPTMISKIAPTGNGSKPKRKIDKTAVKARTTPLESVEWETLFDDYVAKRNAAAAAREKLEAFVKGLK